MAKNIAGHSILWWIVVLVVAWIVVHYLLQRAGHLAADSKPHSPKTGNGQGANAPASQMTG